MVSVLKCSQIQVGECVLVVGVRTARNLSESPLLHSLVGAPRVVCGGMPSRRGVEESGEDEGGAHP